MKTSKNRRLAAIMFTDIVGYTALMQQDENAAVEIRGRHREVFQQQHNTYQGEIIQYFGDGTLSVFQSGVQAVECAIAIQQELTQVPLRIGIHMGDVVFDGTEIYGDGVNVASRIESLGITGAILLSGKLNDELKNQQHILTRSLGAFEFKNVTNAMEVFAVCNEGIKVPARAELRGKQKNRSLSIAVLPFVNMSSDKDNEYFSDGMTEEIINALSKIKSLKVTSRSSSFFFKDKNIPIPQVGRELNVSTILEGSIRLADKKMRITAQLIDVAEDVHFWSETFDRSVDDIFAVQDEVSLLIADKLREHIGPFEVAHQLVENPEVPIEVYKQYLRSRYHILKMGKSDIELGLSILQEVIAREPKFAPAYLGIHLGYTMLGTIGFIPAQEAFTMGQPYLEKAIELNENLPECQLHLSYISMLQEWDLSSAYRHLQNSYAIRPTVEYYQSMASTVVAMGKFEEANEQIEMALQLDPFSAINFHLKGFVLYVQEKYEEALDWFDKSVQLGTEFKVSILYYGQTLLLLGRQKDCLAYFKGFQNDEPGDPVKLGGTTLALAALGETGQAEIGIRELETHLVTGSTERAINLLILIRAVLGQKEDLFHLIEQGIQFRLPLMVYLGVEPILKPFRHEQRFRGLVKQILGDQSPVR
jgi:TolB-like protein/Tfp pilus assembly protein PilF